MIENMTKLESQAKESSIVRTYEVAFVVFGYIQNKDDDIGCIECNGLTKAGENYVLKDGRIYCNVVEKFSRRILATSVVQLGGFLYVKISPAISYFSFSKNALLRKNPAY